MSCKIQKKKEKERKKRKEDASGTKKEELSFDVTSLLEPFMSFDFSYHDSLILFISLIPFFLFNQLPLAMLQA